MTTRFGPSTAPQRSLARRRGDKRYRRALSPGAANRWRTVHSSDDRQVGRLRRAMGVRSPLPPSCRIHQFVTVTNTHVPQGASKVSRVGRRPGGNSGCLPDPITSGGQANTARVGYEAMNARTEPRLSPSPPHVPAGEFVTVTNIHVPQNYSAIHPHRKPGRSRGVEVRAGSAHRRQPAPRRS